MTFAQAFALEQIEQRASKSFLGAAKVEYFTVRSLACTAFAIGAGLSLEFESNRDAFITAFLVRPQKLETMKTMLSSIARDHIEPYIGEARATAELVMKLESAKWVKNGHPADWMTIDHRAKLSKEEGVYVVLEHAINGVACGIYHPDQWRRIAASDQAESERIGQAVPSILTASEVDELRQAPAEYRRAFLDFCDRFHPLQAVDLRRD